MPETPPIQCPNCQSPIRELSGTSKKTGKPYHFWSCSAYPNCQYTWRPESQAEKNHKEIIEALRKLWVKLEDIDKKIK